MIEGVSTGMCKIELVPHNLYWAYLGESVCNLRSLGVWNYHICLLSLCLTIPKKNIQLSGGIRNAVTVDLEYGGRWRVYRRLRCNGPQVEWSLFFDGNSC